MNNTFGSEIYNSFSHGFAQLHYNGEFITTDYKYYNGVLTFHKGNIDPIALASIMEVYIERMALEKIYIFRLCGIFYIDNQMVNEIVIDQYNETFNAQLWRLLKSKLVEECECKLIIAKDKNKIELIVDVKKTEEKIILRDTSTKKKITVFDQKDALFLSDNVLLNSNNEYLYYLIFSGNKRPFDLSNFNAVEDTYYHEYCGLNGSFDNVRIHEDKISLIFFEKEIVIFLDYKVFFTADIDELNICLRQDDGRVVIQYTNLNGIASYITFTRIPEELETKLVKSHFTNLGVSESHEIPDQFLENDSNIIMDENREPFKIDYENEEWRIYQSNEYNFVIPATKISKIEIVDNKSFENILVSLKSDYLPIEGHNNHELRFYVHKSVLANLIGSTYRAKKLPLVKEASITDLYTSWCRQINDYLIYNLFGQLMILRDGINEIESNENGSINDKNHQILNFMYYAIKEQKKILDRVSIEFPIVLLEEEKKFLHTSQIEKYEWMQRQLLTLSNQIQRHLVEIDNSLNALNFAIIPRKRIDENSGEKSNGGYWTAGILAGLGVVTGGIGLIAAGGLLGLNTHLSNTNHAKRSQYIEENDNYKIDFYITKALDSFDHLMQDMLPYYIYQASNIYYSTSRYYGSLLFHQQDTFKENNKKKDIIFNGLVELNTAKLIPLEEGSLLCREDIIEELMTPRGSNDAKLIGSVSK